MPVFGLKFPSEKEEKYFFGSGSDSRPRAGWAVGPDGGGVSAERFNIYYKSIVLNKLCFLIRNGHPDLDGKGFSRFEAD
jgi:hypothetical protein